MNQRNPNWPTDLDSRLMKGVRPTWPAGWSNKQNLCVKCEHPPTHHQLVKGGDGINRVFCQSCPPSRGVMMGDEGLYGPSPFSIEGPFHFIACFEERPAINKVDNFLPLSPSTKGPATFTLQAKTQEEEDLGSLMFAGCVWNPVEFECLVDGANVRKNPNRYKRHLYWQQDGRCAGCKRIMYFDHMEIDRIIPGDSGPGYVVGNVQLLCSSCNKIKGNRSKKELMRKLKGRGLPRDLSHSDVNDHQMGLEWGLY